MTLPRLSNPASTPSDLIDLRISIRVRFWLGFNTEFNPNSIATLSNPILQLRPEPSAVDSTHYQFQTRLEKTDLFVVQLSYFGSFLVIQNSVRVIFKALDSWETLLLLCLFYWWCSLHAVIVFADVWTFLLLIYLFMCFFIASYGWV